MISVKIDAKRGILLLSYLLTSAAPWCKNQSDIERCIVVKKKKRYRFTVLLSREGHERFIAYCADRGFKKSTLVARLIRDYLDKEGYRLQ